MEFKPGIYPGLSRADYDSLVALNQSSIKVALERHMYAAWHHLNHPDEPTEAMIAGTAFHYMTLEPWRFEEEFATYPKIDRRTNAGKAEWAEWEKANAGKIHLSIEKMLELQDQVRACLRHPTVKRWIENALHFELAVLWNHPVYGFPCKARVDAISRVDHRTWVWDLKTTRDATPDFWRREIANRNYLVQAEWIMQGLQALAEADRDFAFVAVETGAPWDVAIYECGPLTRFEARHRIEKVCRSWARCLEADRWPGMDLHVQTVEVPRWALTHERDAEEVEDVE